MNSPKAHLRFLFLMFFTILVVQATEAANPLFAAQRLRLRVDSNTLKPDGTTKVYVEFLDRGYQQVKNDRTRTITFKYASSQQGGSGRFSPPQGITVYAGADNGEITFTAERPGKLFLVAESAGMDSGQILLVIMRPAQSFLSRLFETVAYAAPVFKIDGMIVGDEPQPPVVANNKSPATVYVGYSELSRELESPVTVRITTSPAVTVKYGTKQGVGLIELSLDKNKAVSDPIEIFSGMPGKVAIHAQVLKRGGHMDNAKVEFSPRIPWKFDFDCPKTINSSQSEVWISVMLIDGDKLPLTSDKKREIELKSVDESAVVRFESNSVVIPQGQHTVRTKFRLERPPLGNLLKLEAVERHDGNIGVGETAIEIQSPIKKILVDGRNQVTRGRREVKFRIRLADKDRNPLPAEWTRKVKLSVDRGRLDVPEVIFEKGQDTQEVTYYSPNTSGKFTLTAESHNLESGSIDINVIIPDYWLILFSVVGALMGGIARQLHKDAKFENIKPRWQGETLELGLMGRLVCSILGGLFFYWIVKLGISQVLGIPVLPTTLDLGSRTAAVVLGGFGGWGGTLILKKAGERLFGEKDAPLPSQKDVPTPSQPQPELPVC